MIKFNLVIDYPFKQREYSYLMKEILKHKFFGMPVVVLILQLIYIALVVSILVPYFSADEGNLLITVLFLVVVIIINITWRRAIQRKIKS